MLVKFTSFQSFKDKLSYRPPSIHYQMSGCSGTRLSWYPRHFLTRYAFYFLLWDLKAVPGQLRHINNWSTLGSLSSLASLEKTSKGRCPGGTLGSQTPLTGSFRPPAPHSFSKAEPSLPTNDANFSYLYLWPHSFRFHDHRGGLGCRLTSKSKALHFRLALSSPVGYETAETAPIRQSNSRSMFPLLVKIIQRYLNLFP